MKGRRKREFTKGDGKKIRLYEEISITYQGIFNPQGNGEPLKEGSEIVIFLF